MKFPALPIASPGPMGRSPGRVERTVAAFVSAFGCIVFATAACVDPYEDSGKPRFHGTHQQLGLPPCRMLSSVGFPCPACGMTTAVALLVHGDLTSALQVNWAGVVIALTGAVGMIWLGLLAAGVPRGPLMTADRTILCLTLLGASAAIARYAGVAGSAVLAKWGN